MGGILGIPVIANLLIVYRNFFEFDHDELATWPPWSILVRLTMNVNND